MQFNKQNEEDGANVGQNEEDDKIKSNPPKKGEIEIDNKVEKSKQEMEMGKLSTSE